jgi:hypothetical protein
VNKDVFQITNQGRGNLAAIRDEGVWKRAKAAVAGVGVVTLGVLKDLDRASLLGATHADTPLTFP